MAKQTFRIELDGFKELRKAARDLAKEGDSELANELKEVNLAAAREVARYAAPKIPVRTGRLAASVRALGSRTSGAAKEGSAKIPYAGWIDFGGTIRPRGAPITRPFVREGRYLFKALDERRNEITAKYERAIKALLEKYGF